MKNVVIFTLIIFTLSSCFTSTPLIVNSAATANSNFVAKKNDLSGTIAYASNAKTNGETKATSNALQADAKFAVSNKFFIESQIIQQKETSYKLGYYWGRNPDTITSNKKYNNKGISFGVGFYTKLDDNELLHASISLGWQHYTTNTTLRDSAHGIVLNEYINFKQKSIYLNSAFTIKTKPVIITFGAQQNFIQFYGINSNSVGYSKEFVDTLLAHQNSTKYQWQLYNSYSIAPFKFPLFIKLQTSLNFLKLPTNLRSRHIGISVGLAYIPLQSRKR